MLRMAGRGSRADSLLTQPQRAREPLTSCMPWPRGRFKPPCVTHSNTRSPQVDQLCLHGDAWTRMAAKAPSLATLSSSLPVGSPSAIWSPTAKPERSAITDWHTPSACTPIGGLDQPTTCFAVRDRGGEASTTCDFHSLEVTARARRRPAVPGAVRTDQDRVTNLEARPTPIAMPIVEARLNRYSGQGHTLALA
jgi:hypothetical protein